MENRAGSFIFCIGLALLYWGCSESPSGPATGEEKPFAYHKPRLGATFTMQASASGAIDTTFIYSVADTNATHGGKTGALEFTGYYVPFYVFYRPSGDIEIWGNADYIYGRDSWVWYPLALAEGAKAETYSHDSLISNPNPNDTREIVHDSLKVTGKETLAVNGHDIECIKAEFTSTYTLIIVQYGFKTTNVFKVEYWYAPSLGFWAKERYVSGKNDITFTLIDFTM